MSATKQKGSMSGWLIAAMLLMAGGAAASLDAIPGLSGVALGATAEAHTPAKKPADTAVAQASADETRAAAQRQADLESREANLKAQEAQVRALYTELTQQSSQRDAVRKVADMYAAMPPFKAGPLIARLEVPQAAEILRLLEQEQAAAILAYVEPARGSQLTAELMKTAPAKAMP